MFEINENAIAACVPKTKKKAIDNAMIVKPENRIGHLFCEEILVGKLMLKNAVSQSRMLIAITME